MIDVEVRQAGTLSCMFSEGLLYSKVGVANEPNRGSLCTQASL